VSVTDLWPQGRRGAPAGVLIVSFEDHANATLVPRLTAAGADLARVRIVTAEHDGATDLVSLPGDVDWISEAAGKYGVRLVVVDPLVASLPAGEINSHRDHLDHRYAGPVRSSDAGLGERGGGAARRLHRPPGHSGEGRSARLIRCVKTARQRRRLAHRLAHRQPSERASQAVEPNPGDRIPVLKTGDRVTRSGGSNPSPSAR
jgi:AAA domain